MPSNENKLISFIIPSLDRKAELQNCIESIERAAFEAQFFDWEVIVVLNGIDFNLSELSFSLPENFKKIFQEERILCRAKNFGIEKAVGKYIGLIDDDATLSRDFFTKFVSVDLEHYQCFSGRVTDPVSGETFTPIEKTLRKQKIGIRNYNLFRGTSVFVLRTILENVRGFDERFGPGGTFPSGEESDLLFRLLGIGKDVWFLPELEIHHPVYNDLNKEKAFTYSYATGALLTIHARRKLKSSHHFVAHLLRITLICLTRILQYRLFPAKFKRRMDRRQYPSVLRGLLKGIRCSIYR